MTTTMTTQETEENMDKFSTLFAPSTPRASPILGATIPLNPPQPSSSSVPSFYHRHHVKQASLDSEFGAFVSVGPAEDPLLADFELDGDNDPVKATTFFDKFAQDAKRKVEEKRMSVLDELLMHEDDPMYWLKDERAESDVPDEGEPSATPTDEKEKLDESSEQQPLSPLLQDLDMDFFKKPTSASRRPSIHPSSSPTRSPTAPALAPPTLAPFIASQPIIINNIMSSSPPLSREHDRGLTEGPHMASSPPRRSASYSTLSSRWMSSILRSHPASSGGTPLPGARPSLEGVFSAASHPPPSHSHSHLSSHLRRQHSHSHPSHAHDESTHPHPIAPMPIQITHTTPFAPSSSSLASTSTTNPFGTHVFRPISGAPGFKGEDMYERWDKGYSTDLEGELLVDVDGAAGVGRRRDRNRGREHGKGGVDGNGEDWEFGWDGESDDHVESRASSVDADRVTVGRKKKELASVIDERLGAVKLVGRKEGTQEVLSGRVAEMIRTRLPALARLPRTWTLLYSLDQHGISLNTLYANCERNVSENKGRTAGELVVVRDEGGMTFGVWLGEEGVRNGRGRGYYGSGESFLWKFDGEKLEVFKWTGKNDYVALCEQEYISFGGGDGHYGLYLDENLTDGSSAACPTFGNPPLCSLGPRKAARSVDFECVGLEVWGCGP